MLIVRRFLSEEWCRKTKASVVVESRNLWEGWYGDEDGPSYYGTDDPVKCAAEVLMRAGEWAEYEASRALEAAAGIREGAGHER